MSSVDSATEETSVAEEFKTVDEEKVVDTDIKAPIV